MYEIWQCLIVERVVSNSKSALPKAIKWVEKAAEKELHELEFTPNRLFNLFPLFFAGIAFLVDGKHENTFRNRGRKYLRSGTRSCIQYALRHMRKVLPVSGRSNLL